MSNLEDSRKHLEEFLIQHVPLAKAAGLQVDQYNVSSLTITAPLEKNINDKGTAFGGSLYVACVAAGWGMTYLKTQELGLDGELVIAKGEIEYLSPLKDTLVARSKAPKDEELEQFVQRYQSRGKAALSIEAAVKNEQNEVCVRFKGKYAIVKG